MRKRIAAILAAAMLAMGTFAGCGSVADADTVEIVNVSYDPTRELYKAYNTLFEKHWEEQAGQKVRIIQSHGGSGKQALEVANGLDADVVTLALEGDIKTISDSGLIDPGFVSEFPDDSAPYTSTIVFLVRKENPKQIKDWDDLLKSDVSVITPNPKTSGGACWNFLAAWAYEQQQDGNNEEETKEFMKKLYQNVLVLDSGARGATSTFVEKGQGDVLIAWENEAYLSIEEYPDDYEIVSDASGNAEMVGTDTWVSWAVRKEDTELSDYINSEIHKFKEDGTMAELQEKWFGEAVDLPESDYIPAA